MFRKWRQRRQQQQQTRTTTRDTATRRNPRSNSRMGKNLYTNCIINMHTQNARLVAMPEHEASIYTFAHARTFATTLHPQAATSTATPLLVCCLCRRILYSNITALMSCIARVHADAVNAPANNIPCSCCACPVRFYKAYAHMLGEVYELVATMCTDECPASHRAKRDTTRQREKGGSRVVVLVRNGVGWGDVFGVSP